MKVKVEEKKVIKKKEEKVLPDITGENFYFIKSKRGADARATIDEGGIKVWMESTTAPDWVTSTPNPVKEMGKKLRDEGIIINDTFSVDHTFSSPSVAAAIVMGRNANGLKEWRSKDGKTLKDNR